MAGIEPASERFNPRKSTCVEPLECRQRQEESQNPMLTIRSGPKALFRNPRGLNCGTLTLWRLFCYR